MSAAVEPTVTESHHEWSFGWARLKIRAILTRSIVRPLQLLRYYTSDDRIDPSVKTEKIQIPSRQKGRTITVLLHIPSNASERPPVHINFHGSGFVLPSLGEDRAFCNLVASKTGAVVFDSDYRKAPEHPFPAAPNDAEDVLSYVRSKPELYDLKRLTISGFSAGANLALSLSASSVASQGSEGVKSVQAFYPKTDFTRIGDSAPNKSRMRSGIDLSPFLVDLFNRSYVLPNQSRSDVRLSPHFFESQRFPKRINVFCGDCDLLYPDAKEFVERLRKEGKELVLFHTIEGEGHAWDKMARTKESREERDRCYQLSIESILESWE